MVFLCLCIQKTQDFWRLEIMQVLMRSWRFGPSVGERKDRALQEITAEAPAKREAPRGKDFDESQGNKMMPWNADDLHRAPRKA